MRRPLSVALSPRWLRGGIGRIGGWAITAGGQSHAQGTKCLLIAGVCRARPGGRNRGATVNDSERQMLKSLRSTSFNNAAAADRLIIAATLFPAIAKELLGIANQLELDAGGLEIYIREIHEGRIVRSP